MNSNTSKPVPGPELLNERTLAGIVVHLLGLVSSVIGPGLVYLFSNHEFTRENARNALNWHLSVLGTWIVAIVVFVPGADNINIPGMTVEAPLLPGALGTAFGIVGTVLLLLAILYTMATFFLTLFATFKALTGTVWEYPFTREFVSHNREESQQ